MQEACRHGGNGRIINVSLSQYRELGGIQPCLFADPPQKAELVAGMYTHLVGAETRQQHTLPFTFSAKDGKHSLSWGMSGD